MHILHFCSRLSPALPEAQRPAWSGCPGELPGGSGRDAASTAVPMAFATWA